MRDVMADALFFVYQYRIPYPWNCGAEISFRALSRTREFQPLYDPDKVSIKGAQMKRWAVKLLLP